VLGGLITGLADPWVQPEVADELVGVREAADIADRRQERGRHDEVDPRDGHQPADLRPLHGVQRDEPLDLGDLAVEEGDLPQPRVDGLALHGRQLELVQPRQAPCGRTGRWPAGGPSSSGPGRRGPRSSRASAR
jgi:hypothetical protein